MRQNRVPSSSAARSVEINEDSRKRDVNSSRPSCALAPVRTLTMQTRKFVSFRCPQHSYLTASSTFSVRLSFKGVHPHLPRLGRLLRLRWSWGTPSQRSGPWP